MNQCVLANFRYWMALRHLSHKDVASVLGISAATLYERFRDPAKFRMREIQTFAEYVGIEPEAMMR